MIIAISVVISFIMDLIFGDPEGFMHPVIVIGKSISRLERHLGDLFPKTDRGRLAAGIVLAIIIPGATFALTAAIIYIAYQTEPLIAFSLNTIFGWQALAYNSMIRESRNVYDSLGKYNIVHSRKAVARIVGRDTSRLTEEGVIRATVESTAESFSDGIIAPMLFLFIGGAPLAMAYKAINTMDSMIGYKSQKYLYFGKAAAKLDDLVNLIPSRLSGLLLIVSSAIMGLDAKGAYKIWKRDRKNHASPNSAQTESAMAGALGVRLAGPATYFGEKYDKPYIGDDTREVTKEDIITAGKLIGVGSVLGLVIMALVRMLIWWLCKR